MRVAVYHELPSGGAMRSLYEVMKRLRDRQVSMDVFTAGSADHSFCDLRSLANLYLAFPFQPAKTVPSPFGRLNQWRRWRALHRLQRLARSAAGGIDSRRYDVVFAHPSMWSQAPLVMPFLRTPVVYYCHEAFRVLYERSPRIRGRLSWRAAIDRVDPLIHLYRSTALRLDRESVRSASVVLVNSRYSQSVIETLYGVSPTVCYLGVDTEAFSPGGDVRRGRFVLSVGSLQPNKGFEFLVRSLARLPEATRPPLRLVANAEVPGEKDYLLSLAAHRGVRLDIEVGVSDATLVHRYNEALLVAYAPHNEPFGLVPLEAMACGTPVVGVIDGGIPESVEDGVTGLMVERDEQAFSNAIATLLADVPLREALGRRGREHVLSSWTWDASVDRVEGHLREAARRALPQVRDVTAGRPASGAVSA